MQRLPRLLLPLWILVPLLGTAEVATTTEPAPEEQAQRAIHAYALAVASGDPALVAPLLAPEFQILRSDGHGYDRQDYLRRGLPSVEGEFLVEDLVASRSDDLLVARYRLTLTGRADGQALLHRAPRLTVFRRIDGNWRVSAHANFAAPTPDTDSR